MVHRGPPLTPLRTLAYRRVSTAEQEKGRTSLDAQDEATAASCRAHGLPEVANPLDVDDAASGGEKSELTRDEVHRLLANVRCGNMVLVQNVDRFSRDIVFTFTAQRWREVMRTGGVFVTMKQGFDSRTGTCQRE